MNMKTPELQHSNEVIQIGGQKVEKMRDGSLKLTYTLETTMKNIEFNFKLKKEKNGEVKIYNITPKDIQKGFYGWNHMDRGEKVYTLDTSSQSAFGKSLGDALNHFIDSRRPSMKENVWKGAYNMLGFRNLAQLEEQKQSEIDSYLAATTEEIKQLEGNIDINPIDTDVIDVA